MNKLRRFTQLDVAYSSVLVRLFYFLYYGGCACLFPFFTLYLRHLGLSAPQVGIVFGGKYMIWYLFGPLWIALAVRVQKTKVVLGLSVLLAIASNLSIILISSNDRLLAGNCFQKLQNQSLHHSISMENNSVHEIDNSYSVTKTHDQVISPTSAFLSLSTSSTLHVSTISFYKPSVSSSSKKKEQTFTSSTTVSIPSDMSPYQMALYLKPRVLLSNPKSFSDILNLVSRYTETLRWPSWKQKIVAHQLLKLLSDRLSQSSFKKYGIKTSTSAPKSKPTGRKNSPYFSQALGNVVEDLVSSYLMQKRTNPSLTVHDFLNSVSSLKELPLQLQSKLRVAFNNSLKELYGSSTRYKRELSASDSFSSGILPRESTESLQSYLQSLASPITNNLDLFIMVLAIVFAGEIIAAPVDLLSDCSFYDYVDKMDCLHLYGGHKISAQVATLLAGLAVSAAMYYMPCICFNFIPKDHIIFFAFAIMAGLSLLVIPFYPSSEQRYNGKAGDLGVSLCPSCNTQIFRDYRRALHLVTVFLGGMMQIIEYNFLFWHIEDLRGSSYAVYGFLVAANALATLLALAFGRCFKKFDWIIPLSLLTIASKFFIYSYLKQAWSYIPIQSLNMFGMPLLWTVINHETSMMTSQGDGPDLLKGREQIHIFAQSSRRRAMYNAYVCAYQGIGFSLGSLVAGFGFYLAEDTLVPILRIAAGVAAAWAMVCFLCQLCCAKAKPQEHDDYLTLLDESGDEDELYDKSIFSTSIKGGRKAISGYRDPKKLALSRKKKRSKKNEVFLSCDKELERDWQILNSRKTANIL